MVQFSDIQILIETQSVDFGFIVGEKISEKKEQNARTCFDIPSDDELFALYDATVFGSAKEGLAITTSGMYWRNTASKQSCGLLWRQFIAQSITKEGKNRIRLGGNLDMNLVTSSRVEKLLSFLEQLQTEVEAILGDVTYQQRQDTNDEVAPALETSYVEVNEEKVLNVLHRDVTHESKEDHNPSLPMMFDSYREKLIESYDDNKKIYKGTSFHTFLENSAKELKKSGLFTASIPEKKITNAIETYAPSVKKDDIVALYDNTLFGSAKEGFILTSSGLYTGNKKGAGSIDFTRIDSITHDRGNTYKVVTNGEEEDVELFYANQTALLDFVRNLITYRDMEDAILLLEQETKKRIGYINVSKLLEKVHFCISIGRYEEAFNAIEELIHIGMNQEEIVQAVANGLNKIGEDYYSKGYFELAFNVFEASIACQPNAQAYQGLGLIYVERNQFSAAIDSFNAALELQQDNGTLHGYVGYCYVKKQQSEKALEAFTHALELGNDSFEVYLFRAEILKEKNQLQEAIKDFTRVLELNGHEVKAYKMRGDCFYQLDKFDLALEDYLVARNLDNAQELTQRISHIRIKLGQWEEAIMELSEVIQLGDYHAQTFVDRALAYKEIKEYETAIADFTQALEIDDSLDSIYYLRGICYENLEQYEEAKNDFKTAIHRDVNKEEAEHHLTYVEGEYQKIQEKRAKEQKENKRKLFEAIDKSDFETLSTLLSQGVGAQDEMGMTVLMHAILRGKTDVASALISGSSVGAKDNNGYTAFEIAVIKNNLTIANQLFEEIYKESFATKGIAGINKLSEAGLKKNKSVLSSAVYKTKDENQRAQIRAKIAEIEENLRKIEENKRRLANEEREDKERKRRELITNAKSRFARDIVDVLKNKRASIENETITTLKKQLVRLEKDYQQKRSQLESGTTELDKKFTLQMEEIKSAYYRDLAGEKGEFETTPQYEARMAARNEKKEELDRLLMDPTLTEDNSMIFEIKKAIEEATEKYEHQKAELISRNEQQKNMLTEKNEVEKRKLQQEIEEELNHASQEMTRTKGTNKKRLQMLQLYVAPIVSTPKIGRYDADSQLFPITIGDRAIQLFVPLEKAQVFKETFDTHTVSVEGEFEIQNTKPVFNWNIIIQTNQGDRYIVDSGKHVEGSF